MTGEISSNSSSLLSAPPPPPPLPPADWVKNCGQAESNDKNENTLGSTPSKTSNSTQLKRGLSGISNPNFLEELEKKLKSRKAQKENNVDSETADEGSKNSIHVKNSETRNSAQSKEEDNASDKTKNDRINTKQSVQKKTMTEQHNGVHSDSENQKSSIAEQKKATSLKYSIAILLLFTSGAVAGVCTYFMISAVLSGVAVPVLFAVIASVSALVMFSSAAYLINSHLSAINSEKGVDPNRKQPQYSELQKEAESLEHSNTPTSSLPVMSGTPIVPPPPPPPPSSTTVKPNDLSTAVIRKSSTSDANQKDVQQKQSDTPVDDRSNLLAQIRKGITLKQAPDKYRKDLSKDDLKIPQKQEEESTPGKQENGVHPLNNGVYQNQSQNSNLQEAKKLEHSNEGMQQMDSLAIAIQKQRVKSGVQDEQLDSLDGQYDSFFSLEEEQCKAVKKEQENCTRKPDAALLILSNIPLSKFSPLESPINNLSSNSANVPDDEDWPTQPNSISYIHLDRTRQEMRQEKKEKGASPSATKGSGADQVSNEVQDPSTVSVKDRQKIFE
ncbi:hypothetical protein [Wolbachia endosymbiont of Rhagoletis cingulata]|uniref:hypothetical protein n=1 Tax=Wolbachia endosymbiont of Rhagoletis cingulata TaxID=1220542 RepID=UPI003AF3912D